METALKQRLVGAAVLVALAVIFLPMLVQGPAPESGMSDVPLDLPRAPAGDYATRDIPLVSPAEAPRDGVVGMDVPATTAPAADPASVAQPADDAADIATEPLADTAPVPGTNPDAAELATPAEPESTKPAPARPASTGMFPAPTAGGDYAVNFGSFSTIAAADRVIAQLRGSQLPGYREAATVDGRSLYRVRIGPYATRAEAEAARLRAAHVRDDVGARVVALDADTAPVKPATTATATSKPAAPAAKPAASTPAASATGFAVQVGAFSKPGDATALRDRLRAAGFSAFTESVSTDKGALTRVRVGPVLARADADQLKQQVQSKLGLDGIVRPHP